MSIKFQKNGRLALAGLAIAGFAALLFFTVGTAPAPGVVATAAVQKKPVAVKPRPVVVPIGLVATFPTPTDNTIVIVKAPQYVKISHANGVQYENASDWDCVEDKNTDLIWEKKTQDRGLRDAGNFYSWYNPNEASIGGHVGVANNGKCRGGINCDTDAYIKAVNELKLCGFSDWRLPTRSDLMSLVQFGNKNSGKGLIDKRYFPMATGDWYWASESDNYNPSRAWYVLFYNGRSMKATKSDAKRIRLVRTRTERSMRNMAQKKSAVAANQNVRNATQSTVASNESDS